MVYPGDKGKLSELSATVVEIDQNMKKALIIADQVTNEGTRRAVNVNLQKINGVEVEKGVLTTHPDTEWANLIKGAAVFVKYGQIMDIFNDKLIQQIVRDANDEDKITLQNFLDLMVPLLESDTGVPVRIESTDSMTNLMADLTRR
jgi:hypothetical protein